MITYFVSKWFSTLNKEAMRTIFILIILFMTDITFAQSGFPDFLQGTWKMENKETYEHWDRLNDHTLKGFSYQMAGGQMRVSEYLNISRKADQITYTATVLNQNRGEGISFEMTQSDSIYVFENPRHDFPKKIAYRQLSETELFVSASDGGQKGFSYKLIRQHADKAESDPAVSNPNYDKALADKLGGDDYGMKSYFLVILKTGPNTAADGNLVSESFRGHMDNINRLVEDGKLIVAGPLAKNENTYRGIFILDKVASREAAEELLQTDPAVKNGLLAYEIFTWHGSAALAEYLPFSDRIWKSQP